FLLDTPFPPGASSEKQPEGAEVVEQSIPGTQIVVIKGAKEAVEARVAEKLSQLRYDGKSFDEWRSQWRNELKVEERIEAIKAMTAFGRAGYGREAAEAIFDVAAQYSVATSDPNARERGLIEVVKSSLEGHNTGQGIAVKIWLPLLKERIGSDTALYRGL